MRILDSTFRAREPIHTHPGTLLIFGRIRREVLEELAHTLVKVFNVLVGVVGKRVAGTSSPQELLCPCVE